MNFKYIALIGLFLFGQEHLVAENYYMEPAGYPNSLEYSGINIAGIPINSGSLEGTKDDFFWGLLSWLKSDSKEKKRARRIDRERDLTIQHCRSWGPEDFERALGYNAIGGCWQPARYETIFDDPVYSSFQYYRFRPFRDFLKRDMCYEEKIHDLRRIVNTGKDFNVYGCNQQEFKEIVNKIADEILNERAYSASVANQRIIDAQKKVQIETQKKIQEQVQSKQKEREIYKNQITMIMNYHQNDPLSQYELYQEIEIQELRSNGASRAEYVVKRVEALRDHMNGNDSWQEEIYQVSVPGQLLLTEHGIPIADYQSYYGNQIQHALHQEFVDIVNGAAEISSNVGDIDQGHKAVASTVTQFAHAGQMHNHAGYIWQSFSFADFCHGLIELDKQILAIECDIAKACGRGFVKGGNNFADKLLNPIETLEKTVLGLAKLVNTIGRIAEDTAIRFIEENIQDIRDLSSGKVTQWEIIKRDASLSCQTVKGVYAALTSTWQQLDYQKMLLGIENGTAMVTESTLTGATFGALSSLTKNASIGVGEFLGDSAGNFMDLPLNSNTMQAAIVHEAGLADMVTFATEAIKVAGVGIAKTLDGASKIAPGLVLMQDGPGGSVTGPSGNISNPPINSLQEKYTVYIEGIGEVDSKIAKLDFNAQNHILAAHHEWYRLVKDPKDWDAVARIMTKVMSEGELQKYKTVWQKVLTIGNERVVVVFDCIDNEIFIGNAWIITK